MSGWDVLLSGLLGALVGSAITAVISWAELKRQLRYEFNRKFVEDLQKTIKYVYLAQDAGRAVEQRSMDAIKAFRVVPFKEFGRVQTSLNELMDAVLKYNHGLEVTVVSPAAGNTGASVVRSAEEIEGRRAINAINEKIMVELRRLA